MRSPLPQGLLDDLNGALDRALRTTGIVNVALLAEEIRKRNEEANVALEDVERALLYFAQQRAAGIEFDSRRLA